MAMVMPPGKRALGDSSVGLHRSRRCKVSSTALSSWTTVALVSLDWGSSISSSSNEKSMSVHFEFGSSEDAALTVTASDAVAAGDGQRLKLLSVSSSRMLSAATCRLPTTTLTTACYQCLAYCAYGLGRINIWVLKTARLCCYITSRSFALRKEWQFEMMPIITGVTQTRLISCQLFRNHEGISHLLHYLLLVSWHYVRWRLASASPLGPSLLLMHWDQALGSGPYRVLSCQYLPGRDVGSAVLQSF